MEFAAELEVDSTERPGALDGGLRTIWQLDAVMAVAPAQDRRALAAALHRLLEGWRAVERQVVELVGDRETSSHPDTSFLLDAIARYRVEHARMFDVIRNMVLIDERAGFAGSADHSRPAGVSYRTEEPSRRLG